MSWSSRGSRWEHCLGKDFHHPFACSGCILHPEEAKGWVTSIPCISHFADRERSPAAAGAPAGIQQGGCRAPPGCSQGQVLPRRGGWVPGWGLAVGAESQPLDGCNAACRYCCCGTPCSLLTADGNEDREPGRVTLSCMRAVCLQCIVHASSPRSQPCPITPGDSMDSAASADASKASRTVRQGDYGGIFA